MSACRNGRSGTYGAFRAMSTRAPWCPLVPGRRRSPQPCCTKPSLRQLRTPSSRSMPQAASCWSTRRQSGCSATGGWSSLDSRSSCSYPTPCEIGIPVTAARTSVIRRPAPWEPANRSRGGVRTGPSSPLRSHCRPSRPTTGSSSPPLCVTPPIGSAPRRSSGHCWRRHRTPSSESTTAASSPSSTHRRNASSATCATSCSASRSSCWFRTAPSTSIHDGALPTSQTRGHVPWARVWSSLDVARTVPSSLRRSPSRRWRRRTAGSSRWPCATPPSASKPRPNGRG